MAKKKKSKKSGKVLDLADVRALARAKGLVAAAGQKIGRTYDEMLDGAVEFIKDGERMHGDGTFQRAQTEGNPPGFWEAIKLITGVDVKKSKYLHNGVAYMFSCSC